MWCPMTVAPCTSHLWSSSPRALGTSTLVPSGWTSLSVASLPSSPFFPGHFSVLFVCFVFCFGLERVTVVDAVLHLLTCLCGLKSKICLLQGSSYMCELLQQLTGPTQGDLVLRET